MPCINCIYLILSLVLQVVSNIQNFDAGGTFRCSIAAIKCTRLRVHHFLWEFFSTTKDLTQIQSAVVTLGRTHTHVGVTSM